MTPKVGEVYARDGERRTVRSDLKETISYFFVSAWGSGIAYDTRQEWNQWAAGARVEKEVNNE